MATNLGNGCGRMHINFSTTTGARSMKQTWHMNPLRLTRDLFDDFGFGSIEIGLANQILV